MAVNALGRDQSQYNWHHLNAYIKFRFHTSDDSKVDYKVYSPLMRESSNLSIGFFTAFNNRYYINNYQSISCVNNYMKNLELYDFNYNLVFNC
jgi:hypothetical protein